MNEQDLRDKYIKLISDETPDLWDNIKAALPEKKESFSEKLKRTFFGGSALRTAVSLTALAVIIAGAGGAASGKFRMGSAGGMKDAAPSASSYYGNEAVYNI